MDQRCIYKSGNARTGRFSWCGMPIGQRPHIVGLELAERLTLTNMLVCPICLAIARRETNSKQPPSSQ